jgi:hypothetical protein
MLTSALSPLILGLLVTARRPYWVAVFVGFLSFLAGLILDVVATMRSEMKRLAYLSYRTV